MPERTISVTDGGGSTRTTTIPDRSRFAGVRTMTRTGRLNDDTTSIQVTVAGHSDISGIYTFNSSNFWWTQQGGNGLIEYNPTSTDDFRWILYDTDDGTPFETWDGGLRTETTPRPWNAVGAVPSGITIQAVPETISVDRTAPVITSDRKGEPRPLLSKVVGGAAAAYSLRDLNDRNGNNKVVRVRRASDNQERDFLAKEVSNGTLVDWIGAYNDGSVSIWYDQSGNGKHATQPFIDIQPKIVENGTYFADGLRFPPNRKINFPSDILASTDYDLVNVFVVAKAYDTNGIYVGAALEPNSFLFIPVVLNSQFQLYKGSVVGASPANTNTNLFSLTSQPDGLLLGNNAFLNSFFVNGSPAGTLRRGSQVGVYQGSGIATYSNFIWRGSFQELIIYNKSQAANRPAIEANIANQYDITLS